MCRSWGLCAADSNSENASRVVPLQLCRSVLGARTEDLAAKGEQNQSVCWALSRKRQACCGKQFRWFSGRNVPVQFRKQALRRRPRCRCSSRQAERKGHRSSPPLPARRAAAPRRPATRSGSSPGRVLTLTRFTHPTENYTSFFFSFRLMFWINSENLIGQRGRQASQPMERQHCCSMGLGTKICDY